MATCRALLAEAEAAIGTVNQQLLRDGDESAETAAAAAAGWQGGREDMWTRRRWRRRRRLGGLEGSHTLEEVLCCRLFPSAR